MERVYLVKAPFSDIHLQFTRKKCVFDDSDLILFFNPTSCLGLKCRNLTTGSYAESAVVPGTWYQYAQIHISE